MELFQKVYQYLNLLVRMTLVWLRATMRRAAVTRLFASPPQARWDITAALAFSSDGRFKDITHDFDPATWEEDAEHLTGWRVDKIDLRYTYTSAFGHVSKYRMVLRPGDACIFPPPADGGKRGLGGGHPGIIHAHLVPCSSAVNAKPVNVTERLKKYAGPSKDFHNALGLRVHVADILPLDDWDFVAERFSTLTVVDMHFRKHTFDLASNPEIFLGKHKNASYVPSDNYETAQKEQ